MQQLVEMILSGQLRLPAISPELLSLEQEIPKTDLLALLMLYRRGEATMSELAADLNVPLSTATGIGARLTRRKLIERERSAEDRRVIVNRLTGEGRELAVKVQGHIDTILQRITSVLTPDEVATLMTLVQKVLQALGEEPAPTEAEEKAPPREYEPGARRIPLD
ncbi:MAG: MarR family winged helix-turn-helix transcriptional regulator [Bacillota bacterium]